MTASQCENRLGRAHHGGQFVKPGFIDTRYNKHENLDPTALSYALYSMIALVISGIIGRVLDRIAPKLVAHEVKHVLAAWGEDRVEVDTHTISSTVLNNRLELYSFEPQRYAKQSVTTLAS